MDDIHKTIPDIIEVVCVACGRTFETIDDGDEPYCGCWEIEIEPSELPF